MATQLDLELIRANLFKHWSDSFPLAVTTVYPGMNVDNSSSSEWIEIAVENWSRKPQRTAGKQFLELVVVVHCFVKAGTDKGRILELADATRSTISQKTISLKDFDLSGEPTVGYLRLHETETRDRFLGLPSTHDQTLQHVSMSTKGFAHSS